MSGTTVVPLYPLGTCASVSINVIDATPHLGDNQYIQVLILPFGFKTVEGGEEISNEPILGRLWL